jgi:hypothetical protein
VSAAHVCVTIDFELDSEPIAGSLRAADGRITTFNGWIELVPLLQVAARTRAGRPDPESNGTVHFRPTRR